MKRTLLKEFFKNVIPAMIASVVLGTFSIIDGLFIGNQVGDIGLAAINFAFPINAFVQSIGFGVGMGGAIMTSIARGANDSITEKKILFNTYVLLIVLSAILFPLTYFLSPSLLHLFGAKGQTYDMGLAYIKIIIYGTLAQMLGQGLSPIIRNLGYNKYTMTSMCIGFLLNLILDYLLIIKFNQGLEGAAIATICAQALSAFLSLIVLLFKKNRPIFKLSYNEIKEILILGLSPFGIAFSANIVLIIVNKVAVKEGGDTAIAAYTAVSYIVYVIIRLLQGVCDGSQPLMSFYYGAHDNKKKNMIYRFTMIGVLILGVLSTLLCFTIEKPLACVFGLSDSAKELFKSCLWITASSFIALGIMKGATSYFYAQNKNKLAFILVYGEPIIAIIVVLIFPIFMGLNGVWISAPISQFILGILSIVFSIKLIEKDKAIE